VLDWNKFQCFICNLYQVASFKTFVYLQLILFVKISINWCETLEFSYFEFSIKLSNYLLIFFEKNIMEWNNFIVELLYPADLIFRNIYYFFQLSILIGLVVLLRQKRQLDSSRQTACTKNNSKWVRDQHHTHFSGSINWFSFVYHVMTLAEMRNFRNHRQDVPKNNLVYIFSFMILMVIWQCSLLYVSVDQVEFFWFF